MVSLSQVDTVTVLGVGNMGHGIAEVSAIAGYDAALRDIEDEYVQGGYDQLEWSAKKLVEKGQLSDSPEEIPARVETATDLEAAVSGADIVIEAASGNLGLERDIFSEVEASVSDKTIITTNTSSLRVNDIAAEVALSRRCCGLHFFNSPVKMDLVEVVYGEKTTEDVVETTCEFAESLDKTPIYIQKDVPEFVVNSVLTPFMEKAGWMLDDGIATVESVDAMMVYERGYPMGPCELNDFGDLDILAHTRDQQDRPIPESIRDRVEADKLGRKTGAGFYDYDGGPGVDYGPESLAGVGSLRIEAWMINAAAELVGDGVATPEDVDTGMRLGGGLPEGTCRTASKIGLDAVLEELESLYSETGADRYAPADYLVELVEDGNIGEAAGQGFYNYFGDGPYFYLGREINDRGALSVTLDRQERLNAFSDDMFAEVERLMTTADVDNVRCVVFESAGGKAFSSGTDVMAFITTDLIPMVDTDQTMVAVAEFERPTIARIDGYCFDTGLEPSLACDSRVASDGSSFASSEIDLDLILGGGGTQRFAWIVGEPLAKEMIFRGTHLSASETETADLLSEAVPGDELDDTIESYISDFICDPPTALKVAKCIIDKGQDVDLESGLSLEKQGFSLLIITDDMVEGVTASREDRESEFIGE